MNPLLRVDNLRAGYGPIEVLRGISFEVHEGEIVALLGANGAGKTTTLRCLSGCGQRMLAVARALMARPRLLLLDQPSLGLAPLITRRIFEAVGQLNRQGMAVLLVEQNARLALQLAQRGYVLETGAITLSAPA